MSESNGGHENFGRKVYQVMEELGMVGTYLAAKITTGGGADQDWLDGQNGNAANEVEDINE